MEDQVNMLQQHYKQTFLYIYYRLMLEHLLVLFPKPKNSQAAENYIYYLIELMRFENNDKEPRKKINKIEKSNEKLTIRRPLILNMIPSKMTPLSLLQRSISGAIILLSEYCNK